MKDTERLTLPQRLETLDRIIRGWVSYFRSLAGIQPKAFPVLLSLARIAGDQRCVALDLGAVGRV